MLQSYAASCHISANFYYFSVLSSMADQTKIQFPTPRSCEDDDAAYSAAMTMTSAVVPPMILRAVVDLGVLEIIKSNAGSGGFMSPEEIAAELPTTNPTAASMLDRMLRVLACYGVLTYSLRRTEGRPTERAYGLAPMCKFLTADESGASLGTLALLHLERVGINSWYHLKDAVLEGGIPFNKGKGINTFEYHTNDKELENLFSTGMWSHTTVAMKKLLQKYNGFENISTIVDVGGNVGTAVSMIVSKYPTIKGINFDLPHVINKAPSYQGVEHVEGDMFVSIPEADAIFMKWVLHDWSDDQCIKILKNCYAALPDHGKVIVFEHVMPEELEFTDATKHVVHLDAIMLAHLSGKERTEKEFEELAKGAGFQEFKLACSTRDMKAMEFFKRV